MTEPSMPDQDLDEQEEALIGYVAGAFPAYRYALKSARKMVEDYRKAVELDVARRVKRMLDTLI